MTRQEELLKERAARNRRRNVWWSKHWWKVISAVLFIALGIGIQAYLNSDAHAYRQAEGLYESSKLEEAVTAFRALDEYRDAQERANEINYEIADNLYELGDLSGAISAFEALGSYRDSDSRSDSIHYKIADSLYESGDLSGAASAFEELGRYRDSEDRVNSIHGEILGFTTDGGIITDTNSGLQWCVGPDRDTEWYEAYDWVDNLGGGWRMPTLDELGDLYDAGITRDDWGPFENSGGWVFSGDEYMSSGPWVFSFSTRYRYWPPCTATDCRAFGVRQQ